MSWCRRHGTTSSTTPTTESKRTSPPQTPAETHARATHGAHRPGRHRPDSRSYRICGAATTKSPTKYRVSFESPPRSPKSPRRSDTSVHTGISLPIAHTTQWSRLGSAEPCFRRFRRCGQSGVRRNGSAGSPRGWRPPGMHRLGQETAGHAATHDEASASTPMGTLNTFG